MFVYLDHNATTPVHPEVLEHLPIWAQYWGNPSSIHKVSREPKKILRETRKSMAELLNVHPLELIFTSGGSESNNTAIKGTFGKERNHYLVSSVEHPSVFKTFEYLKSLGASVDYIPVNQEGVLDLDFVKDKISEKTALVSVMFANNETGVIHPIKDISQIAKSVGALVHSDCVQALGKVSVDLQDLNIDMASFSAHKFYALKGTGVLFHRRGTPFQNLIHGGAQERARRAGTENILSIASLGYMASKKDQILEKNKKVQILRNDMEKEILSRISDVRIIGRSQNRLPNTSSLFLEGVDGETLLMNLDMHGICVSTGAACSSGSQEPSPVLRAMGYSRKEAQSSLRVTLGWLNDENQMDYFLETLKKVVTRIRSLSHKEVGT
jgi:cysteine desulfurase